jgi:catechol 2,3-dioxygenase-like lactoylglutathione lyase family enzyme
MKKLILTSLLAVFAVSAADAANIINDNPLYRPDAGRFYSITSLNTHSDEDLKFWGLDEEFGYGISDKMAVIVGTDILAGYDDDFISQWNNFSLGLNYRLLDASNLKADVFGKYNVGAISSPIADGGSVWGYHEKFLDENLTFYTWTLGIRGGYVADNWTLAGHFAFDYLGTESLNWGDEGLHRWRIGLDGQYELDSNWNLVAGAEYASYSDDFLFFNTGTWNGTFGVNYNIDETKFVGAYIGKEMHDDVLDGWKFSDGIAWGLKFGADF